MDPQVDDSPAVVRTRRAGDVVKFASRLADGAVIESVLVPMRTRDEGGRLTLCVSTQVGCRMGCAFCATARMGFWRNLSPEEIVGQVATASSMGSRPDRLAFMGMGEPLDNFDNWFEAVRRLTRGGANPLSSYSVRDMIVSTCGWVPGMDRLAALGRKRLVPAVSLNAPNDEIRSQLMPVNRRYPMAVLREALLRLPLRKGVFLAEYVVIKGVNDRREHAKELAGYLRPFRACVNLIAYNRVPQSANPAPSVEQDARGARGLTAAAPSLPISNLQSSIFNLQSPTAAEVERFKRWLNEEGQYARRRIPKGGRIAAACGQLATP